jgi:hypothetical protein
VKPRLVIGPLTGRIYVTTRYRELPNGVIEAQTKYDVTSDFMAVKEIAERDFNYTPVEKSPETTCA